MGVGNKRTITKTRRKTRRGKPHKRRVKQLREEPSPEPQRMPGPDAESQIDNRHDNVEHDASGDMEMAT
ncbi:hypothetical protein MHUMG1_03432 [Metarhizium humberi]|uniref:Uncharacterized protein n=1 Tax=Metarhizium humberi TaxID=2596975 RepID=A0A9P8MFF9_9HYPO|nr:hypothetical protein MHUMG1_03432 [Metarhizium humberi]